MDDNSLVISVDSQNNVIITGYTFSNDFPTVNNYQNHFSNESLGFVTKLNAQGNKLVFSSYIGGNGGTYSPDTMGVDVATDLENNCYIVGYSPSGSNILLNDQITHVFSNTSLFDTEYGFVIKLNKNSSFIFGDLIEGSMYGITVDNNENIFITGSGYSIHVQNEFNLTPQTNGYFDVYVAELSQIGSNFIFYTTIGGSSYEFPEDIKLDSNKDIVVTGETNSTDFPIKNGLNITKGTFVKCFVFKLSSNGSKLLFSSVIGGSKYTSGSKISIDSNGNIYLVGTTDANDFPSFNPYNQTFFYHNYSYEPQVFFVILNETDNGLLLSMNIGFGTNLGLAMDQDGNNIIVEEFESYYPMKNTCSNLLGSEYGMAVLKFSKYNNNLELILNSCGPITDATRFDKFLNSLVIPIFDIILVTIGKIGLDFIYVNKKRHKSGLETCSLREFFCYNKSKIWKRFKKK